MNTERLPDGWELEELGKIAFIAAGGTPSRGNREYWSNGTIPWVKISDIMGREVDKTSECITQKGLENSSAKIFPRGTILLSIFATLGDVGILEIDAACNQAIAGIQIYDKEKVDNEYLYYYLRSLKPHFERLGRGVAQNNINQSILKQIQIPIPPLDTQRKIVAILEKAEATQRLRAEADVLTQQLLQNVYMSIFGDPISNPQSWDIVKLECVCKIITDGEHATPKRSQSGIYLLSARNIRDHEIDLSDVDYIDDEEYDRISKRIVPQNGDVLISCSGSVGRMSRVKDDIKFQMVRSVALIRPDNQKLNSAYLEYTFDTAYLKMQIAQSVNQSSQANLFQGKIRELKIPIPPMDLQQVFAEIVEKYEQLTESQRITSRRALTLYNSLLSKAFIGELIA